MNSFKTILVLLLLVAFGCTKSASVDDSFPNPGAHNVAPDTSITVHFSHAMTPETLTADSFLVYGKYYHDYYDGDIAGSEDGTSFTFQLATRSDGSNTFLPGEEVTVTLTDDITGTDNIPYKGSSFTFYVEGEVPELYLGPIKVTSATPQPCAVNVSLGTPVNIDFSRPVQISSVQDNISVFDAWTGFRSGKVTASSGTGDYADSVAFVPDKPFSPGEKINIFLSDSIRGEVKEDTLDPYGFSFTMSSGAVSGTWQSVEMVSGVGARSIAAADIKLSSDGLEVIVSDENKNVYIITPANSMIKLSQPFDLSDGDISAIDVGDPFETGNQEILALALVQGKTDILFLAPEGFSGIAESRDRLEIDGEYGKTFACGNFDSDPYVDVVLGGADGLAFIAREVQDASSGSSDGGIPNIGDLLNGSGLSKGDGRKDASFVRLDGIFPSISDVTSVKPCDLNGDGRLDLLVRHGGHLSYFLWTKDHFGEANTLCELAENDNFTVMHIDSDVYPEVIVCRAVTNPYLEVYSGSRTGPGSKKEIEIQLPPVVNGRIQTETYDLSGKGADDLLLAANDWSDIYVLAPGRSSRDVVFDITTIPFPGVEALKVADFDGDSWPELFVSDSNSMWLLNSGTGPQPSVVSELFMREENISYLDDKTVQVTVSGSSSIDFDSVKISMSYDPSKLELLNVDYPENGYFNEGNSSYTSCTSAEGCSDRVITALNIKKTFDLHQEVKLATFTFSFVDPEGADAVLRLENGLLDADNAKADNSFHFSVQDSWALAGLTLPEVTLHYEGKILEIACSLNDNGDNTTGEISWSSPSGNSLQEIKVKRNGALQYTGSGPGSWTDQSLVAGTNSYEVSVYKSGSLLAKEFCELLYVPTPELVFCGEEGQDLVIRWSLAGNVDGFKVWRDGNTVPVKTFYGTSQTSYSENNNPDDSGHLFGVSAFIGNHESDKIWCEAVIGGNQTKIEFPTNFTAENVTLVPFAVDLTWSQGQGYEEIKVLRNGSEIAQLGLVTTYRDLLLPPGQYTYQLRVVSRGSLQDPVTSPPVTIDVPLCTGLSCSLADEGQVQLQWINGSKPYSHFSYDSIVLNRTWITPEGVEQELPSRQLASDAEAYLDTVNQRSGKYRYTLRAMYNDMLLPEQAVETCEVEFNTKVYPVAVTLGAGLEGLELPVKADLVGVADEVRFTFGYAGGTNRLVVTGFVPGPGLDVEITDPVTTDDLWYSSEVIVHGPVNAGKNVRLCNFLVKTAPDFAVYGYDEQPPSEEKKIIPVQVTDVRVKYPGEDLLMLDPVEDNITVTCRYLLASSMSGLSLGDTFSMPIFGTFDQNLLGFTLTFSYDTDVLECLGETIDDTDTPPGIFLQSNHDNENGVAFIAWIANFQPAVQPLTPGINKLIAYLQFKVVGPGKPGEEVLIEPIEFEGQSHSPLLTSSGWVMGKYLEQTFGADVDVESTPKIESLSDGRGPLAGGNRLEIRGRNFGSELPIVLINGKTAAVVQYDNDYILCTVPPLTYSDIPTSPVQADVSVQNGIGVDSSATRYIYMPLSTVSVDPDSGPVTGGNQVRISGEGIDQSTEVFFGVTKATVDLIDQLSGSYLLAKAPSGGALGEVDIRLASSDGEESILSNAYTYVASAPLITSVTPDHGPLSGGTSVVISGDGFLNVESVLFGAEPASSFVVVSPQRVDAVSPPGNGSVMIKVQAQSGEASIDYLYQGNELTIDSFLPVRGTSSGGTRVTLNGHGFQVDTDVYFNDVAASSVEFISDMKLAATTPPGIGQVLVKAQNPGQDLVVAADPFTYEDSAAVVSSFQPQSGPPAGGNTVDITGIHFIPETTVGVNGTLLQDVEYVSDTALKIVMPSGTGSVTITVQNPDTQANGAPKQYVYEAGNLSITGVTPDKGSRFGGTTVQIHGQGFFDQTRVFFDNEEISTDKVNIVSDVLIELETIAHDPGAVNLYVQNPDTDKIVGPGPYTFEDLLVANVSPPQASVCGSSEIVFNGSSFNEGISVLFGTEPAKSVEVVSEEELKVSTPKVPAGTGIVQIKVAYNGISYNGPDFTFQDIVFIRGDTNGDGIVSTDDGYLLRDYIHGIKNLGAPLDAADVNDNGVINIADVDYLFQFLFAGGEPPKAPFPGAGTDPTPDSLEGCSGF